jgi:hypothetical protein
VGGTLQRVVVTCQSVPYNLLCKSLDEWSALSFLIINLVLSLDGWSTLQFLITYSSKSVGVRIGKWTKALPSKNDRQKPSREKRPPMKITGRTKALL